MIDPLTRYEVYQDAVKELRKYDDKYDFENICFSVAYIMRANGWTLEESVKWAFENSKVIKIEDKKKGLSIKVRIFTKEAEKLIDKYKKIEKEV